MANTTTTTNKKLLATQPTGKPKVAPPPLSARQAELKKATPAFKVMYDKMLAAYNGEAENVLRSRYEQGLYVQEMLDPKTISQYGGKKSVKKMAFCLGADRTHLQHCKSFADTFDEDQVDHLIKARTTGGNAVTWSHVTILWTIKDPDDRDDALAYLLKNDLTFADFKKWKIKTYGESSKANNKGGQSGNKDRRPETFAGFIASVTADLGGLVNRAQNVWLKDEADDPRSMRALFQAATVDRKTIKEVESAATLCQESISALSALAREFSLFVADATSKTSAKPSLAEEGETSEEEEETRRPIRRKTTPSIIEEEAAEEGEAEVSEEEEESFESDDPQADFDDEDTDEEAAVEDEEEAPTPPRRKPVRA